jgi:hypothetical protein
MVCIVTVISIISGYFFMLYKIFHCFKGSRRFILLILSITCLPLSFFIGIAVTIAIIMYGVFFRYLELALSAKLFPCYIY